MIGPDSTAAFEDDSSPQKYRFSGRCIPNCQVGNRYPGQIPTPFREVSSTAALTPIASIAGLKSPALCSEYYSLLAVFQILERSSSYLLDTQPGNVLHRLKITLVLLQSHAHQLPTRTYARFVK